MIFADLALARRLERQEALGGASFVEARQRASPEAGAKWEEIAGTYAMFDGVTSPITQTFGLGLFADVTDADLDRIEAFFVERGAPVSHEVSPLAGVELAQMLVRRGYRPVELTSVMYMPVASRQDELNPRLRTRLMAADEEDAWSSVSARGWASEVGMADLLLSFGQVMSASEGLIAFFADVDGVPSATASLRCNEGVALFCGACTVPEARKQGAQRALLSARMDLALSRGCDLAMMCAHSGTVSQRNAERLGFRIAYTRTKWQLG